MSYNVTKQCNQIWGEAAKQGMEKKNFCEGDANETCNNINETILPLAVNNKIFSQGISNIIYNLCPDVLTTCCGETNTLTTATAIKMAKIIIPPLCSSVDKTATCAYIKEHILEGLDKKGTIPKELLDVISQLCPDAMQSICEGKISPEMLKKINEIVTNYGNYISKFIMNQIKKPEICSKISLMFDKLVTNPQLLDMIDKIVNTGDVKVNIQNYQVCDIVQIFSSMGVDVVDIFMDKLGKNLEAMNIKLTKDDYTSIVSCICPQYTDKNINCDNVILLIMNITKEQAFKEQVKREINTQEDFCLYLKEIVDIGNDPVDIFYNYMKSDVTYTPSKEKILEAILCICPSYTGPKDTSPRFDSVLNKLNVGLLTIGTSIVTIILYLILSLFVFRLFSVGVKIILLLILVIITVFVVYLIIKANPNCIFRFCPGDDWRAIPGTYTGENNAFGVKIKVEVKIDDNKKIRITNLDCSKGCPFKSLNQVCTDANEIILGEKTGYGYILSGKCIDSLKSDSVKNLWLTQNNDDISLKMMLKYGVMINIPIKKIETYTLQRI